MILYENMLLYHNIYQDPYIHGRAEDVRQSAINVALKTRGSQISSLVGRYMDQLADTIKIKNVNTGEIIDIRKLGPNTLQSLMSEIANAMNANVQAQLPQAATKMLAAIEGAYANVNFIQGGQVQDKTLQLALDNIFNALELVTNTSLSPQARTAFRTLYAQLLRGSIELNDFKANSAKWIERRHFSQGVDTVNKTVEYLSRIPQNIVDKNGNVTASIQGSLRNIMATTIGEALGAILSDVGMNVQKKVEQTLTVGSKQSVFKSGQGYKIQRPTVGKVDVYSGKGLTISTSLLQPGENQYVIEGQLNSSVKWYADNGDLVGATANPLRSKIKIGSYASLIRWVEEIFGISPSSMYGVYNTLAWRHDGANAANYEILKTSIIQKNMELFISGKGTQLSGGPAIDTSAFLLINGQFYSVLGILAVVEAQLMRKSSSDMVYINLSNTAQADEANKWIGEGPDLLKAYKRSAAAKAALKEVGFTVTLNGPALNAALRNPIFDAAKLTIL